MKKVLSVLLVLGIFGGGAVIAQTAKVKGLKFVAPTVKGSPESTVDGPELGEIVYDAVNNVFKGFNGGPTWATLDNSSSAVPHGTISAFAGTTAPAGYVFCDGTSYDASAQPELAAVLWDASTNKYAYGGSGTYPSGSFNVPDLRGRFARGADDGTARDLDAGGRVASQSGGNSGDHVGSLQLDAFQGHKIGTSQKVATNQAGAANSELTSIAGPYDYYIQPFGQLTQSIISDGSNGTPRVSSETRPQNVYVKYIIKL